MTEARAIPAGQDTLEEDPEASEPPLNILITTYTFDPDIGGVTSFNMDLCEELVRLAQNVTLASLTPGEDHGRRFRVVRRPRPDQLFRLGSRADVILFSNLSLQLALPLMTLRKPMGLFHHSEAAWLSPRSRLVQCAEKLILRRMNRHFPTSRYTGLASRLPHTVIYPPFRDVTKPGGAHVEPAAARTEALFVGRLVPEKGVALLLDRQADIRRILGCKELVIAGDGEMGSLVEAAARASSGVTALGRLSRPDVMTAMRRAAYVIVPSLTNEPLGIVALEALAAGAILVSSSLGGLPEAAGRFAHYFDPADPKSFDRALTAARAERDRYMVEPDAEADRQVGVRAPPAKVCRRPDRTTIARTITVHGRDGGLTVQMARCPSGPASRRRGGKP